MLLNKTKLKKDKDVLNNKKLFLISFRKSFLFYSNYNNLGVYLI